MINTLASSPPQTSYHSSNKHKQLTASHYHLPLQHRTSTSAYSILEVTHQDPLLRTLPPPTSTTTKHPNTTTTKQPNNQTTKHHNACSFANPPQPQRHPLPEQSGIQLQRSCGHFDSSSAAGTSPEPPAAPDSHFRRRQVKSERCPPHHHYPSDRFLLRFPKSLRTTMYPYHYYHYYCPPCCRFRIVAVTATTLEHAR